MNFGKREARKADAAKPLQGDPGVGDRRKPASVAEAMSQLSPVETVFCAWPMVLVFMGGAIGGACGGGAWAINIQIMKSDMSPPLRYALAILVGLGAFAAYFIAAVILALLFPGLRA